LGENDWEYSSPYEGDGDLWLALLCDAFGTRHGSVVQHFLSTIAELVPAGDRSAQRDGRHYWYPDETQFNAALAIISAMRPENEAQAAHAAQLVALHLAAMKLAAQQTSYADPRTAAILAKTTRAYGDGMMRLANLQGRVQPKQVNQTIQVVYVDNRDQRSVHFNGGDAANGGQPQATYRHNTATHSGGGDECGPALPSASQVNGQTMPGSCSEGEKRMPGSWRSWWRTLWRAQR
jgi:hypothetical protein